MFKNRYLRLIVAFITLFLPWALKRPLLNWLLGYQLNPSAWIGFSIVAVSAASMGEGARVGHLTVIRGLKQLELGDFAHIGNLNWITGNDVNPFPVADTGYLAEVVLMIGSHSAITNRHYIDCMGGVIIGGFTTIAGVRSQMLTHSINLESCIQQVKPIVIGDYCFVGTGCIILSGSNLPNNCVLAPGSVLRSKLVKEWSLYAGVPAKALKEIPSSHLYFHRLIGFVE
jgi:acetyltransferase-like isoleucine patch superfamily enzyme